MRPRPYRLTLSMTVHNEADRYLSRVLQRYRPIIDQAVIIDDGSTDHTVSVCEEILNGIPLHLIRNEASNFKEEHRLRKQQWEATLSTDPDWILNVDADELFDQQLDQHIEALLRQHVYDAFYFRLYDMWNETHYREDYFWRAHLIYRPFLVRPHCLASTAWKETNQHCGRFPLEIEQLSFACHSARIQHFGWATPQDRLHKAERYRLLDPEGQYGWLEQYESILDPAPPLVAWEE
ncbi:glycosyltransferase [Paenibacillus sp. 481]|uniref:glycosyltransferase n=1 Tax=Paenibacillus sp. 481 TaxID=2835869 RepID=UPI001E4208F9|nr:glycosyltransferase [Paenibacillus sp. 481]UHA72580.1 glycosyltransferase [Paenibacillus sp. 481]